MPRQQRVWGHEEHLPARPREQPARRRQASTVRGPKCRARDLSAQHRDLVAQDDDLQLLELRRAKAQQHERHHPSQQHVQQRRQHQPLPSSTEPATLRPRAPKTPMPAGTIEFMHPTGRVRGCLESRGRSRANRTGARWLAGRAACSGRRKPVRAACRWEPARARGPWCPWRLRSERRPCLRCPRERGMCVAWVPGLGESGALRGWWSAISVAVRGLRAAFVIAGLAIRRRCGPRATGARCVRRSGLSRMRGRGVLRRRWRCVMGCCELRRV